MNCDRSLRWSLVLFGCGLAVAAQFLTRLPSSLPREDDPWLYYGFFSLVALIPLLVSLRTAWHILSVKGRRRSFIPLLILLAAVIAVAVIWQAVLPAQQLAKACLVLLMTILGTGYLLQNLRPVPDKA